MMNEQHVLDSAGACALAALDPQSQRAVEEHLAICPGCRAEVQDLRQAVKLLPLACKPASPSTELKRRIMSAAAGDVTFGAQQRSTGDVAPRSGLSARQRRPIPSSFAWSAAAAMFIAGVLIGTAGVHRGAVASREAAALHARLASQRAVDNQLRAIAVQHRELLSDMAHGRVWEVQGGAGDTAWHCTVVQAPSAKRAMLLALAPKAPAGMHYQAWIIRRGFPHNAGAVKAGAMTMMRMPMQVQSGDVLAFTEESAASGLVPAGPIVMQATLSS